MRGGDLLLEVRRRDGVGLEGSVGAVRGGLLGLLSLLVLLLLGCAVGGRVGGVAVGEGGSSLREEVGGLAERGLNALVVELRLLVLTLVLLLLVLLLLLLSLLVRLLRVLLVLLSLLSVAAKRRRMRQRPSSLPQTTKRTSAAGAEAQTPELSTPAGTEAVRQTS